MCAKVVEDDVGEIFDERGRDAGHGDLLKRGITRMLDCRREVGCSTVPTRFGRCFVAVMLQICRLTDAGCMW